MDKLLEFGRKALFYVRVLSGYEERRIRNFRLQLEKQIKQAQERKAALRKIPEKAILGEVRRMVEEMQTLNKKLEETYEYEESPFINTKHETEQQTRLILIALGHALFVFEFPSEEKLVKFPDDEKCGLKEAAIEDYFKPIDKEAEIVMKMQLEGEEKTMKDMMKTMHQQALLEKAEAEKVTTLNQTNAEQHNPDQVSSTTPQQAQKR